MVDGFDKTLISTCDIQEKPDYTSPDVDSYGQPPQTLTTVVTGVKCRVSTVKGGVEYKTLKESAKNSFTVYTRPIVLDDNGDAFVLTTKHWILFQGQLFNIQGINNPSFLNHHFEIAVEQVLP